MAWYRFKRLDKEGRKTYEIRHNESSKMWTAPEGWSDRAIDKELQKEAVQFANECQLRPVSNRNFTFIEYANHVLDSKRSSLKDNTILFYKNKISKLSTMPIASVKLTNLKPMHLNNLYSKLEGMKTKNGKPLSLKKLHEFHGFISSVLNDAVEKNIIPFNVAKSCKKPQNKKTPSEIFEINETSMILEAIEKKGAKWSAITHMFLASGARRGEIVGLRWKDIDMENNIIHIHNNLQYIKSKGVFDESLKTNNERYVTVAESAIEKLLLWKEKQDIEKEAAGKQWQENDYIFTQTNGRPMNPTSVTSFYNKLSKKIGIDINAHMFRHFQASVLIDSGVSILTVSKRLGHKVVSTTTDIYAHLLNKADAKASGAFEAVIYKKQENIT